MSGFPRDYPEYVCRNFFNHRVDKRRMKCLDCTALVKRFCHYCGQYRSGTAFDLHKCKGPVRVKRERAEDFEEDEQPRNAPPPPPPAEAVPALPVVPKRGRGRPRKVVVKPEPLEDPAVQVVLDDVYFAVPPFAPAPVVALVREWCAIQPPDLMPPDLEGPLLAVCARELLFTVAQIRTMPPFLWDSFAARQAVGVQHALWRLRHLQ